MTKKEVLALIHEAIQYHVDTVIVTRVDDSPPLRVRSPEAIAEAILALAERQPGLPFSYRKGDHDDTQV